ncbi:hypothetical protein PGT21_013031 [Puccinia graminis f. sp. tritici]|uniref:Uncharacterized protein n=1 Tax=Puccinia graminis f. sp. tritici TaxID=56615 RepID=A0A5B0QF81_PUCGR|nr:hypothetical protein PGT21_013031 [Puccinia graminis f. sp. tritici]
MLSSGSLIVMAFTLGSSETAAKDGSTPDYLQSPLSSGCHPVSLLNELRAWSSRRCPLVKVRVNRVYQDDCKLSRPCWSIINKNCSQIQAQFGNGVSF